MQLFNREFKHAQIDQLDSRERKLLAKLFHEQHPEVRQRLTVAQGGQGCMVLVLLALAGSRGLGLGAWLLCSLMILGALGCWALGKWGIGQVERELHTWVKKNWSQGQPTLCLSCGYDLRGNSDADRCPECGKEAVAFDYWDDRADVSEQLTRRWNDDDTQANPNKIASDERRENAQADYINQTRRL